jgi:tight adherence protein C
MNVILVEVIAFAAAFLLVVGIKGLVAGGKAPLSAAELVEKPGLFRIFGNEIDAIGSAIEVTVNRAFPAQTEQIRNHLIVAALDDRLRVKDLRGMQGLASLTLFLVGGMGTIMVSMNPAAALLVGLVLGLGGWMYPPIWVKRIATQRQDLIFKALPYAIDLLTVAMQAGQDFGAAVRFLVEEGPRGPLRQEFAITLRQTELGKSRVEALRAMAGRVQLNEFKSLSTAVIQSTEMGSSVAETLKLQAEEIRRSRFHRAERRAARAPSIMLIPIALFILPAVFIVIFTPVVLRIKGVFSSVQE